MSGLEALILGALQGITEFLPISSSGHLVIGEEVLGLNVADLKSFDVAVHIGTLLAILVYFWKDIWGMVKAFFGLIGRFFGRGSEKSVADNLYEKLIGYILVGTVPAVIVGLGFEDAIDGAFRNVLAVGMMMIIVGVVFVAGEFVGKRAKKGGINLRKAIVIGLAQSVALIPGVSRSGSTIVAGLFQGVNRSESARFSFLLGVPAMAGAGILTAMKIFGSAGESGLGVDVLSILIGFITAFSFGLLSIFFLMKFLKKHSLLIFAIYLTGVGVWVVTMKV